MDKLQKNIIVRYCMISAGCLCVILGIAGLFLPMMPGAVFLIMAAWLFARSSERFHTALLNHRYIGPQIQAWQSGQGFERKLRRRILLVMWSSMLVTVALVARFWVTLLVLGCGAAVTVYILTRPVYDED